MAKGSTNVQASKPKGSIKLQKKADVSPPQLKRKREEEAQEEEDEDASEDNEEEDSDDFEGDSGDYSDDLNDEFSEAEADSSEMEDDQFESEDENVPSKSRLEAKKEKEQESFAKAMSAILQSKVKAHDRENPILVRSKKTAKDLETSRLDAKARRALAAEKKQVQDKDRVRNLLEVRPQEDGSEPQTVQQLLEQEKKLRKIAQRGVVRLFNAVLASQTVVNTASNSGEKILGLTKKEEQMTEMSKDTFLDLIRSGGKK
ncbi:Rrp15p [Sugiyamaella lignohabitans]|uniref:Rrp15p n=1 Tax=Sugiyamaella lignohabitans TaxID=796027 RepID=A0A161HFY9_9ASCO|nr:Rrp15p [Sugiyamaella lignohabitans]ANB14560.1 Rrp15p [Sugiyamaella lignohabitans]